MEFYLTCTRELFNRKLKDSYDFSGFKLREIETPNYSYSRLAIEIDSLSDLIRLIERVNEEVIISRLSFGYKIEIYNDYRE